jgi:hypothetical protein
LINLNHYRTFGIFRRDRRHTPAPAFFARSFALAITDFGSAPIGSRGSLTCRWRPFRGANQGDLEPQGGRIYRRLLLGDSTRTKRQRLPDLQISFPVGCGLEIRDCFAEPRVRLRPALFQLRFHPPVQFFHDRRTVFLMKKQTVRSSGQISPGRDPAIAKLFWAPAPPFLM